MERWRLLEAGIDLMARKDSSYLGVELGGDLSQRGTKIRERERERNIEGGLHLAWTARFPPGGS
jgi:hypothetical protein